MYGINPKKIFLSRVLRLVGLEKLLFAQQRWRFPCGFVQAINYHSTPAETASSLERQFHFYRDSYSPVSLDDLKQFFDTGHWFKPKPGLIISFDDGVANNYSIAAPLLEKYDFIGWFFIPLDFCDTPSKEQIAYAEEHKICKAEPLANGRVALSWKEIKKLARRHVIGNHTRSHCRLWPSVRKEQMREEIVESKYILEQRVGSCIEVFCWVGGEVGTYNDYAMRLIKEAGYKFAFTTIPLLQGPKTHPLMLGRSNIEAHWPMEIVKFQLCGAMELLYLRKRRQVHRELKKGLLNPYSF